MTYFLYIKRLLRTTDVYIGKEMARELDNLIDKFNHVICCIFSLNAAICKKIIALACKLYILASIQYKVLIGMCVQSKFKEVCASAYSDQSLSFPPEETLGPWLPIERTSKTQIRLRMRAV